MRATSEVKGRRVHFAIPGDLSRPTGGYEYDRKLIEGLRTLGWEVRHSKLAAGYPTPSSEDRRHAASLLADIGDGEVVLVDGLAFGAMAEIARHEARRLRLVALVHHPLADETGLDPAKAELFMSEERKALHMARAVICTSAATARRLTEGFGVASEHVTVAMPGTPRVARAPADGIPPKLLSLGSLVPRKGHDVLISALGHIRNLDWTAQFVGDDRADPKWTAHLHHLAADQGLTGRIGFSGVVDDTGPSFMSADVFVLASRHEGYGMAFAEALAHGLPIVACRAGAVPELVPKEAGWLVAPDDAAALADALSQAIGEAEVRGRAAEASWHAGQRLPRWADTAAIVGRVMERIA